MQSYPLHTHNVVLFLVSSWKQTFGVRRVVSVADWTWENIDLTFSSLWVRHSILITSTFGNCYDDSCTWGLSSFSSFRVVSNIVYKVGYWYISNVSITPLIYTYVPQTTRYGAKNLIPPPQPSIPVRSHLGAFSGAPPEGASITEGFYINMIIPKCKESS